MSAQCVDNRAVIYHEDGDFGKMPRRLHLVQPMPDITIIVVLSSHTLFAKAWQIQNINVGKEKIYINKN